MADGEEVRLIKLRAARQAELKREYIKQFYNPYRHASGEGGVVFDPALYRYLAMKATQYEHFKPNFKTGIRYYGLVIFPIFAYVLLLRKTKDEFERKCRNGEITYAARKFKFLG